MKLLKDMPYFKEHDIRATFQARVVPDMTQDAKDALQAEYRAALKTGEKAVELERKQVAAANLAAFLANPKAVLDEIEATKGQSFETGEMLLYYGIATVTSKRHGKGTIALKHTDFSYISSNFTVTAVIGSYRRVTESGSSNDRRAKASMHSMFARELAFRIAAGGGCNKA